MIACANPPAYRALRLDEQSPLTQLQMSGRERRVLGATIGHF
jgi:hypothetical protein